MQIHFKLTELKALAKFMPKNDIRKELNGVYFDTVNRKLVSTDTVGLLAIDMTNTITEPLEDKLPFIIPYEVIKNMISTKNTTIHYAYKTDMFSQENMLDVEGLAARKYPKWEWVIPKMKRETWHPGVFQPYILQAAVDAKSLMEGHKSFAIALKCDAYPETHLAILTAMSLQCLHYVPGYTKVKIS